ncbi:TonB family protein [Hydrogenimonas sp. SS33]|uniref:energy transducer TonB n=1 Tax=Hydrogenimonas leucolamina TaxID=2954236 RepID=UPI00336C22D3
MNRRKLFTFFLSLFIHLTILLLFFLFLHHNAKLLTSSGAKRVELSLKDFTTPPGMAARPKKTPPAPAPRPVPPQPKPQPKTPPKPKPLPKPEKPAPKSQPKPKPIKKPSPKPAPRPAEKPKKIFKKPSPRPVPEKPQKHHTRKKAAPGPRPIPKPHPKPRSPQKTTPESALAGALGAPAVPSRQAPRRPAPPSIDQINGAMGEREFRALYKDEFDHFTPNQKKFIRNNLNRIQAITQHYLTMRGYPPFAIRMHMQGMNIVEFWLWPNGDITDLKVITSSGFDVLDQNSIDTIKTAYKDYPRPKEKTKIRFYIHYQLY